MLSSIDGRPWHVPGAVAMHYLNCPFCQGQMAHDPSSAGRVVSCPYCGQLVQIPPLPEAATPTAQPVAPPTVIAPPSPAHPADENDPSQFAIQASDIHRGIEVFCPTCDTLNVFPEDTARSVGTCCNCGEYISIPASRVAANIHKRQREEFHSRQAAAALGMLGLALGLLFAPTLGFVLVCIGMIWFAIDFFRSS